MFPLLMLPQCACFPLRLLLQIVRSVSSVVTDEQSLPRPAALLRLRDRRFHLLLHAAGSDPVCKRIHQRKYMPGETPNQCHRRINGKKKKATQTVYLRLDGGDVTALKLNKLRKRLMNV